MVISMVIHHNGSSPQFQFGGDAAETDPKMVIEVVPCVTPPTKMPLVVSRA